MTETRITYPHTIDNGLGHLVRLVARPATLIETCGDGPPAQVAEALHVHLAVTAHDWLIGQARNGTVLRHALMRGNVESGVTLACDDRGGWKVCADVVVNAKVRGAHFAVHVLSNLDKVAAFVAPADERRRLDAHGAYTELGQVAVRFVRYRACTLLVSDLSNMLAPPPGVSLTCVLGRGRHCDLLCCAPEGSDRPDQELIEQTEQILRRLTRRMSDTFGCDCYESLTKDRTSGGIRHAPYVN